VRENTGGGRKDADIVAGVVVNAAQTETILFGNDGSPKRWRKMRCSSRQRRWTRMWRGGLTKTTRSHRPHYLDAPISGGAQRAAQDELTNSRSAAKPAFDKARPALDAMRQSFYELGDAAGRRRPSR